MTAKKSAAGRPVFISGSIVKHATTTTAYLMTRCQEWRRRSAASRRFSPVYMERWLLSAAAALFLKHVLTAFAPPISTAAVSHGALLGVPGSTSSPPFFYLNITCDFG